MKKLVLVTLLIGLLLTLVTGCGKTHDIKKAEAKEVTVMDTYTQNEEPVVEEETDEVEILYTVDEAKSDMYYLMSDILVEYEDYGWSIEMRDEILELCESVVYDETMAYGFDFNQWQIDFVNILVDYEKLPEVCRGLTFEDLEDIYDSIDELM
jgi:hypothetical protein